VSSEERKMLQTYITTHNITTQSRFDQDSINELQQERRKYKKKNENGFQESLDAHMKFFSNKWNMAYDIKRDRNLTLESYLEYCKAHNFKPREYIKYIN